MVSNYLRELSVKITINPQKETSAKLNLNSSLFQKKGAGEKPAPLIN